jgi:hypothetical protein
MRGRIFLVIAVAAVLTLAGLAVVQTAAGDGRVMAGSPETSGPVEAERDACEVAPVVCSPIVTVSLLVVAVVAATSLPASTGSLLLRVIDPGQYLIPFIGRVETPPPRCA